MKGYRFLLSKYPGYVGFGALHYLFSSFGQTFLISVFVPEFIRAMEIDNNRFALIYSGATLIAALFLPYLGLLVDKFKIRYVSIANGIMLALFCWIVSHSHNTIILFIGIVGLRMGGQGMMVIIGSTAITRYFTANRGKALSLSALGLPIGETILPPLIIYLMYHAGWQITWVIIALIIVFLFIPGTLGLVRNDDCFQRSCNDENDEQLKGDFNRRQILKDPIFYILLPTILFIPFFLTGMFIHQNLLAEMKGWNLEWMGACISGYGAAKLLTNFLGGPIIDRYSARSTFSFQLIPIGIGIIVLLLSNHALAYLIFLITAGVTTSFGSLTNSAIWAEMYGPRYLGSIKSIITTFVILFTALGTIVIDKIYTSVLIFRIALIITIAAIFVGVLVMHFTLMFRMKDTPQAEKQEIM